MRKPTDWTELHNKTFHTITGTSFTVINVSRKSVIIRPEHGRRNYDLSISNELERGLDALAAGNFFPSPSELLSIGVRHERNSYVWGVLRAFWQNQLVPRQAVVASADFAGEWQITALAEMDRSYLDESDEPPFIKIARPQRGAVSGEYHFGLSGGTLDGAVRVFGAEQIFMFGYMGFDEMDEVSSGGWARVNARGELEGEFVNGVGHFTAERLSGKSRAKRSRKK